MPAPGSRNPLSIQVCFNLTLKQVRKRCPHLAVVIPYQFRSVSMPIENGDRAKAGCVVIPYQFRSVSMQDQDQIQWGWRKRRNPLSIQVCFNQARATLLTHIPIVVIPYQFRSVSMRKREWAYRRPHRTRRNPLSIQVCFNRTFFFSFCIKPCAS